MSRDNPIPKEELAKGGIRADSGKERTDLIPAIVLLQLARLFERGAEKYEENNWRKGMKYSRMYGSLTRHLFKWWEGERYDQENGLHHLTAVVWNAVGLLFYELYPFHFSNYDDRVILSNDANVILRTDEQGNYIQSVNQIIMTGGTGAGDGTVWLCRLCNKSFAIPRDACPPEACPYCGNKVPDRPTYISEAPGTVNRKCTRCKRHFVASDKDLVPDCPYCGYDPKEK